MEWNIEQKLDAEGSSSTFCKRDCLQFFSLFFFFSVIIFFFILMDSDLDLTLAYTRERAIEALIGGNIFFLPLYWWH